MKRFLSFFAALLATAGLSGASLAQDFGPSPADYRYAAHDYVESRLNNPRGMRIQFRGAPYAVFADFGRHGEIAAWAVDISVRMHVRSRRHDGVMDYTVIFVDGEPVAFEEDIRGLEIARGSRYAARR